MAFDYQELSDDERAILIRQRLRDLETQHAQLLIRKNSPVQGQPWNENEQAVIDAIETAVVNLRKTLPADAS